MRAAGLALLAAASLVLAPGIALAASPEAAEREAAVSALFDKAVQSPTMLRVFLREMPKGGDLHNHLGGAIYAEDYIEWARAKGFCADESGLGIEPPPCPADRSLSRVRGEEDPAPDRLIDSFSTRGFQQGIGRNTISGHGQFFQVFSRFAPIARGSAGKMLVAELRIAAGDRLSYVELDHNTDVLSEYVHAAPDVALDESGIIARYAEEIRSVAPLLKQASAELDRDEAFARHELACDTKQPEPACAVTVHYLFQAFRALPPAQAFRSLVLAFAMADHDPRFVGINIVQPEDAPIALRDYDLHMAMIRFLAAKYPRVRRTLHAGELTLGLVAPQHLRDHIAKAVAAGAERIGHGTDIAFEENARATMARMAREGIAVELNLTSNDVILGVKGENHPLHLYRSMGVPIVIATDDQGVLRTDMTNEYVRAAREQGLRYGELKGLARASLEFSFVPGASLWADRTARAPIAACATSLTSAECTRFLATSEKARLEADLENRFAQYERAVLAGSG